MEEPGDAADVEPDEDEDPRDKKPPDLESKLLTPARSSMPELQRNYSSMPVKQEPGSIGLAYMARNKVSANVLDSMTKRQHVDLYFGRI